MKKINIPIFYYKGSRRSLSQKQKRIINSNLDKFRFKKLKKKYNKVFLDIGFGYGENMIHLAKRNLNTLILGCEIYLPGISNLLQRINNEKINNIQIFDKNIFLLFKKIKKTSIDKVFLLFPDPWPKKKHFKRRIVSSMLLDKLKYVLKKDGKLYIATDSKSYLQKIFEEFFLNKSFVWINFKPNECLVRPAILSKTKYETKADTNFSKKFFLIFKKRS